MRQPIGYRINGAPFFMDTGKDAWRCVDCDNLYRSMEDRKAHQCEQPRHITKWTVKALTRQCLAELDEKYYLVYIDRGDELGRDQVAALARGDFETLWESITDWEGEARHRSASESVNDLVEGIAQRWERTFDVDSADLVAEWESTDDDERLREVIYDRDQSDVIGDLARNTSRVLMRTVVKGEDDCWYGGAWPNLTPTDVITGLRDAAEPGTVLKRNKHNVDVVRSVLNEAFHTNAYLMGMLVYAVDPTELHDLGGNAEYVDIVNPYLYLGNYYMGDGWCSDKPLQGVFRVKREDVRTDRDAPGYGWDEVAGVVTSYYEAEIRPVPATEGAA